MRWVKHTLVFFLETALLVGISAGLYHVITTRAPAFRNAMISVGDEPVREAWPINIRLKNTVAIQGVIRNPDLENPVFTVSSQDCPTTFTINEIDVKPMITCQNTATGTLQLAKVLQEGENPFAILIEEMDDHVSLDMRIGTGTTIPEVVNMQYVWNDHAPVSARFPLNVRRTRSYNVEFDMHVPKLHPNTYRLIVRGCVADLQINGLSVSNANEICSDTVVNWGEYLHEGWNSIRMRMEHANGHVMFEVRENSKDTMFLFLQTLLILTIGIYGLRRVP